MKNVTCYACHKQGHIAAYYHKRRIDSNQQRMQRVKRLPQANRWRRQPFIGYTNCFYGYCFYCKEFGHKAKECRTNGKRLMYGNSRRWMNNGEFTHVHNSFKNTIKFYDCHQVGHKCNKCPLRECGPSSQERYLTKGCMEWKKKLNKCDLALIAQDQKNQWYLDSGCSKHMTGD